MPDQTFSGLTETTTAIDSDILPIVLSPFGSGTNRRINVKNLFTRTRLKLSEPRTYYVSTTGLNTNDGLTNSTPFLTIQKAVDTASALDNAGHSITIQLADGTYTSSVNEHTVNLKTFVGSGKVIIQGNPSNSSSVTVSNTSLTDGINVFSAINVSGTYLIRNLRIEKPTTTDASLISSNKSYIEINNIVVGTCHTWQLRADNTGIIFVLGSYSIASGAAGGGHILVEGHGAFIARGTTITLINTPNFGSAFIVALRLSQADFDLVTFSGSGTGKRYAIEQNSVVRVPSASTTILPGSIAGVTLTGGLLI